MPRMMNCSIIGSDPILFDCCPAYGYRYCCYIQQMKSMVILVNAVTHISFWVYRNNLPIFDYNRMNLMHNLYSLLIETTYVYCYNGNKSIWCSMISIIVMLRHIISCIRFCSIMVVLITITSYLIWLDSLLDFV